MKKLLMSAFFVLSFGISAFGQQLSYFDENWQPSTKEKMSYYRESYKQDNGTLIKDFYKNGVLQMEGNAIDTKPGKERYHGKVTWYFPNGKPESIANYNNGEVTGEMKSYDEDGRILEDYNYTNKGKLNGKSYVYSDVELGIAFNNISETKNGELSYVKAFKSNDNPLGFETFYKEDGSQETKYYNEKGKLIGTGKVDKDLKTTGTEVTFDLLDFHINRIIRYDKNGDIKGYEAFYSNGVKAEEYIKKSKEAIKINYDKEGKQIGKLTSKFDNNLQSMQEYSGQNVNLDYETMKITSITQYNNYKIESLKNFNSDGQLVAFSNFENELLKDSTYYHPDGTVKGKMIYKEGEVYDGEVYSDDLFSKYKNGILLESQTLNQTTGKLVQETKFDSKLNVYNTKVYDENGKLKFSYKKFESENDNLNAEIIQFKNGKQISKATVNEGILVNGKIRYKDNIGETEQEAKGNWLFTRKFTEDNIMYIETKELRKVDSDEYYRPTSYINDEALLNSY